MSETARYKYPLQLPKSLKETAAKLAKEDGVSLNQWIIAAVAQKIGAVEAAEDLFSRRAKSAKKGALMKHLKNAPDTPPVKGDELPKKAQP